MGYYLDVSLLDNVTLYDSFVPVEFGRFNGGVIDAKIKRFDADDSKVKLGYRTTRSDWLTSHIDENNKSAFNQGSSGSTSLPDFKKNFYTLSFNQELADNFGIFTSYRAASLISPARIMFRMTALSPVGTV